MKHMVLEEDLIVDPLKASSAEDALDTLGRRLLAFGYVKPSFIEAVKHREKECPTGIKVGSRGIALPHADSDHTLKPGLAIGIAREPIMFGQMADPAEAVLVDIVIMIAAGEADLHMHLLSVVAVAIQDQSFLDGLLSATSRRQVLKLVESCLGVNIRMQSGF